MRSSRRPIADGSRLQTRSGECVPAQACMVKRLGITPRRPLMPARSRRALALLVTLAACATHTKQLTPAAPAPAPALPAKQGTELEPFSLAHLAEGAKLLDNLGKTGRVVTTR